MSYSSIDFDQQQRLEQDAIVEEIYISGMGDAMAGIFPQMAELIYLQGFAEGMCKFRKRVRASVVLPVINEEIREFPLVCGQCVHLIKGRCHVKDVARKANSFACTSVSIDCHF